MLAPILHAGRFGWDEAVIFVVAILAVPVVSWFHGRFSQSATAPGRDRQARRARRRERAASPDESTE